MTEQAQPTPADAGQGNSGTPTPGSNPAATPEPSPYAVFDTEGALMARIRRDAKRQMNEQAKALGYESWAELSESLAALRPAANQPAAQAPSTPAAQPAAPAVGRDPATPNAPSPAPGPDLNLAIQAATQTGLPVALITRLRGDTLDELLADARALLALAQTNAQGSAPGIPPVTQPNSPVTFTRAQLQDAKFVRDNRDAILRAGAEGRIVNS